MRKTKLLMASCAIMCAGWSLQAQAFEEPTAPDPSNYVEFTEWANDEGATHYYLYNPGAKLFYYSGFEYNTRAALSTKGFEMWFIKSTEDDAPAGSLEFWNVFTNPNRSDVTGDHNVFTDDSGNSWCDHNTQAGYSWTVSKNGDSYRIQNVKFADKYFGWDGDESNYRIKMLAAEEGNFIDWKFVTVDSYEAFQNAVLVYAALLDYSSVRATILSADNKIDLTAADAQADAATSPADVDEAIALAKAALNDYLTSQTECEIDVTNAFVVNPSFETGNTTGWTYQSSNDTGAKANSDGVYTIDNADGNWVFNIWSSGNPISQTIEGLPNGNYKMTALIATDADHQVQLNANTQSVVVDAAAEGKGHGVEGEVEFAVLDGTATIGAEGVSKYWYKVDNFHLYFLGALTDLTPYEERLEKAVSDASAIVEETVPTGAYSILQSALNDYNKTWSSADEYDVAIKAIEDATKAAKALMAPYAEFLDMKAIAEDLASANSDNESGKAYLNSEISNQSATVEAAETKEEITTATADLKSVMADYANNSNPVGEGERFNLTFMLTNPDLTNLPGWEKAEGWYNDQTQPTQNSQVMNSNNAVANSADPTKFAMYEYWSAGTEPTQGYVVYQKVTLPEGTYKMTALAFAGFGGGHRYGYQTDGDHTLGSLGEGNPNITFSAGDIDGTPINTPTLEPASIDFVQEAEGEVKIGLKAHTGNRSNWMGIGYVELFKVQSNDLVFDENEAFEAESVAGNVTLKREMNANEWNTFAVPFSITNEELMIAFGEGTEVAEFSEALATENEEAIENESIISFDKMETPAITANRPVLLKPAWVAPSGEYEFLNRTVAEGIAFVSGLNFEFVGNYDGEITLTEQDYFLNGNKIYQSNGTNNLKGTRAYITPKAEGARIVGFFIDGVSEDVTAIEGLQLNSDFAGKIYNLNGQQVKSAKKGLYIREGKKVVVK